MTKKEICDKYKVSESSLYSHFKRVQEQILKKYGVKIVKEGRGDNVIYIEEIMNDNRAEDMFKALEPVKPAGIIKNDLSFSNFVFNVFLGIITTPMFVFRGSYEDFLKYIKVGVSEENIEKLKRAIDQLMGVGVIGVLKDFSGDIEIFTATLIRKAELDMKIDMEMLIDCKMLANKYRKQDWIPLIKVQLAIELLNKNGSFTRQDLIEMTGLSLYAIRESIRILKDSNIFVSSRAYTSYTRCIGVVTDMNHRSFYKIVENK